MKFFVSIFLLMNVSLHAVEKQQGKNHHVMIVIPEQDAEVGEKDLANNPLRRIHLKKFLIAETETTVEQFSEFIAATKYITDAEKLGYGRVAKEGMADWSWESVKGAYWKFPNGREMGEAKNNQPVTQISGADARAYCKWLGVRLPTFDEWEVAASAGVRTRYPWGENFDATKANIWNGKSHRKNLLEDGFMFTSPVKSFPPNAWGLYDVIGNVFEYCDGMPQSLSALKNKEQFIVGRGGSWWCSFSTCSYFNLRDIGNMTVHGSIANQGFRVADDIE